MDVRSELELLESGDEWQASSHHTFHNIAPEALFDETFAIRYSTQHEILWFAMIRLHGTLETLKELESFPFNDVYSPGEMEFWRLTQVNFVDSAILQLHKLVNDSGGEKLTLKSFKAEIIQSQWKKPELKNLLMQTLRERSFDQRVKKIGTLVATIRNNYVGHLLVDKGTGAPKIPSVNLNLHDLEMLFKAAHKLFGAISFGASFVTLSGDLIPSMVNGERSRTCLQLVLDAVIRDSAFVNQPEQHAPYWDFLKGHISQERLQRMNELRNRIGLPNA